MNTTDFISDYREAFGLQAKLPVAFWYSDTPETISDVIQGCLFKCFYKVRKGIALSLSADTITCGGGLLYTGFTEMPERVPRFVSLVEKYKQTPESVAQFIDGLKIKRADKKYLNFSRIDNLDDFTVAEGLLFFATPDVLSGLVAWTCFDNDDADAVVTTFGSGCSQAIAQTISENDRGGRNTFLGGFDPSVRPYLKRDELTFAIPACRFEEMLTTMKDSCLYGTKGWGTLRKRVLAH